MANGEWRISSPPFPLLLVPLSPCLPVLLSLLASGKHVSHFRLPRGEGPRLVEDNDVHVSHHLDGGSLADEHAVFGPHAAADHQRRRSRQPQRTGAGDDQHRHGGDDGQGECTQVRVDPGQEGPHLHQGLHRAGEEQPGDQRQRRNADDDGHEDRRHPVGELLNRHLGALRFLDQSDDLSQEGILTDAGRPDVQQPRLVDRRADDLIAGLLVDRHTLAGGHALVHGALAGDNDPIGGDFLAGPDDHRVTDLHVRNGHLDLPAIHQQCSGLSTQLQQFADGLRCPSLGRLLDVAASQVEGHNHRRHASVTGDRCEVGGNAGQPGDTGTHGNERVHVGAAVGHRLEGRDVSAPADPEKHRCGQHQHPQVEDQTAGPDHPEEHLRQHPGSDGHSESPGDPHPSPRGRHLALILVHLCLGALLLQWQYLVAHVHDRLAKCIERRHTRHILDGSMLGGDVDRGGHHAVHFTQRPLDGGGATGASHPTDGKRDGRGRHVVSHVAYSLYQFRCGHVSGEGQLPFLGGDVDAGILHALDFFQRPLHRAGATGAGHANNRQLHRLLSHGMHLQYLVLSTCLHSGRIKCTAQIPQT